ncbi:MAG: hypothetical protein AAB887_01265 [Patescibacteria group bacterium]
MAAKDVLTAFPVTCYGVSESDGSPLRNPITASVTIGKKGERNVGCCYLASDWKMGGQKKGECLAASWGHRTCPHLIPINQGDVPGSESMAEPDSEQNIPF